MRLKVLKNLFLLSLALLALIHGGSIPMSQQMPLFEGLRNTSAIIFGVMGAWLAILHPDSLKKIFARSSPDRQLLETEEKTIRLLLTPIIISTTIIAIVLIIFPMVEFGKTVDFAVRHKELFRSLCFSILSVLTILQLWALVLTLVPGDIIKKHLDKRSTKKALVKRMFIGTKKKASDD
jgi:hypothetical protein